jgi:hypothetical protein
VIEAATPTEAKQPVPGASVATSALPSVSAVPKACERSFEEMKDYIREKLHQQLVMFKVQKFIRQATESAGMQVYADRIAGK